MCQIEIVSIFAIINIHVVCMYVCSSKSHTTAIGARIGARSLTVVAISCCECLRLRVLADEGELAHGSGSRSPSSPFRSVALRGSHNLLSAYRVYCRA